MAKRENPFEWWHGVLCFILSIILSLWLHGELTDLETKGGSMRVHWIIAAVYSSQGKIGTCWFVVIVGVIFWLAGFLNLNFGHETLEMAISTIVLLAGLGAFIVYVHGAEPGGVASGASSKKNVAQKKIKPKVYKPDPKVEKDCKSYPVLHKQFAIGKKRECLVK